MDPNSMNAGSSSDRSDSASASSNMNTGSTIQQGWGNMGGDPGDGVTGQSFYHTPTNASTNPGSMFPFPNSVTSISAGSTGGAIPSTPAQAQPAASNNYHHQQQQPPGSGSITRFAIPALTAQQGQNPTTTSVSAQSFAARSAQAYATAGQLYTTPSTPSSYSPMVPPQHQYQQQQQYQPLVTNPSMAPSGGPAPPGSYAARSAQAYSVQQQPSSNAGPYGIPSAASQQSYAAGQMGQPHPGGSYSARSAESYLSQSQGSMAPTPILSPGPVPVPRSTQPYGVQPQQASQQQQVQQQRPVQPMSMPPGPTASTGSSYAARSAEAYTGTTGAMSAPNTVFPTVGSTNSTGMYPPQATSATGPPNSWSAQPPTASSVASATVAGPESPQAVALQQRLLTEATRKVQEHAYYMKQAMEQNNIPVVLDRAAFMVGELGGLPHGQPAGPVTGTGPSNTGGAVKLSPKNYYELYMRALEEMPTFEDFLLNLVTRNQSAGTADPGHIQIVDQAQAWQRSPWTMRELYDSVKFCPRVLSRLYLQISAGSALIRSGEVGAKWVMRELGQAVKCEQNPIRGLFLRHYLLTVMRDKLPDSPLPPAAAASETTDNAVATVPAEEDLKDPGTVKDSYEFVLANFMEMNKLWVRIQHLPGEGKNKDVRKRRERERNDLRILVGTNLVRLSQLEHVTSKIYGEVVLPQVLEHIVTCGDPLSQAYLMDCLVQVFPDEYHIETLPILLNVCPRLRDKVNIRTILQGLMDRLANYLADEELLDESDTNQVKKALARDSFSLFEECVQNVYNARGPKLTSREVIRLQTALLQFSIKCYPGNMSQVGTAIGVCVSALRQANASYDIPEGTVAIVPHDKLVVRALDAASVAELEKLLSIPLDSLALKVLELEHYSELIGFLPWDSRREVAISMLKAVENAGYSLKSTKEMEELFQVIVPLIRQELMVSAGSHLDDEMSRTSSLMAGLGMTHSPNQFVTSPQEMDPSRQGNLEREINLVSKLVHLLEHDDTDTLFEMLRLAAKEIILGPSNRYSQTLVAVAFAAFRLARRIGHAGQAHSLPKPPDASGISSVSSTYAAKPESEVPTDSSAQNIGSTASTTTQVDEAETKELEENKDEGQSAAKLSSAIGADDVSKEEQEMNRARECDNGQATQGAMPSSQLNQPGDEPPVKAKSISCRHVFVFIQETTSSIAKGNPEAAIKLFLEAALAGDQLVMSNTKADLTNVAYEMLSQAVGIFEEAIVDSKAQQRCIISMVGTLLSIKSLGNDDYESLITKTAQFSAKVVKKAEQCELVAQCAHLFYPTKGMERSYSNPQRALECLQRSLKLADACTTANPSNVHLFVDLLEHYVAFFEAGNPAISHGYITSLVALVNEHLNSFRGDSGAAEARNHFVEVVNFIKQKKNSPATSELFAPVQLDNIRP